MSSPGFFSAPSADWILCVYLDSIIYGLSNGLRWLAVSQALAICSLELVMWRYGYQGADQNEPKFGFCPLVLSTCISSRVSRPTGRVAPPRGRPAGHRIWNERQWEKCHRFTFSSFSNLVSWWRWCDPSFLFSSAKWQLREVKEPLINEMDNRDVSGNKFSFSLAIPMWYYFLFTSDSPNWCGISGGMINAHVRLSSYGQFDDRQPAQSSHNYPIIAMHCKTRWTRNSTLHSSNYGHIALRWY